MTEGPDGPEYIPSKEERRRNREKARSGSPGAPPARSPSQEGAPPARSPSQEGGPPRPSQEGGPPRKENWWSRQSTAAKIVVIVVAALVALGGLATALTGNDSKKNTEGSAGTPAVSTDTGPAVTVLTQYRKGYANTSCRQLPGTAQIRFFIYMHNRSSSPAGYDQDVHVLWKNSSGKIVDAFQNTMIKPYPKVQPRLYKIIYSDFGADAEHLVLQCWIRLGSSTKNIPVHVLPLVG